MLQLAKLKGGNRNSDRQNVDPKMDGDDDDGRMDSE